MSALEERIRSGLGADVMVSADDIISAAAAGAHRSRRQQHWAVGIAAAAAVLTVTVGVLALTGDGNEPQRPVGPSTPTPTPTQTKSVSEAIPTAPPEGPVVRQVGRSGLEVAGETVPGRWGLTAASRDVWVAIKTDENEYESQWWGKGTTMHPMPPSRSSVLPGSVVISQDAHWIVWTRPVSDVYGTNPPRVMEVVDTATGEVRWSRNADADVVEGGTVAVTNDGVVVFTHCLEPVLDGEGLRQCARGRVDVWSPEADVVGALPAGVSVSDPPFSDNYWTLTPLVQRMGPPNGLLVRSAETARPQYVHVSALGDVEVVATLPRNTVAVTVDERFALLGEECATGGWGCGELSVVPLDGGERRPIPSLEDLLTPPDGYSYGFVVERDDLLLVQDPFDGDAARCSLAQARCVPIKN